MLNGGAVPEEDLVQSASWASGFGPAPAPPSSAPGSHVNGNRRTRTVWMGPLGNSFDNAKA